MLSLINKSLTHLSVQLNNGGLVHINQGEKVTGIPPSEISPNIKYLERNGSLIIQEDDVVRPIGKQSKADPTRAAESKSDKEYISPEEI
jgi:hypothetical protein